MNHYILYNNESLLFWATNLKHHFYCTQTYTCMYTHRYLCVESLSIGLTHQTRHASLVTIPLNFYVRNQTSPPITQFFFKIGPLWKKNMPGYKLSLRDPMVVFEYASDLLVIFWHVSLITDPNYFLRLHLYLTIKAVFWTKI